MTDQYRSQWPDASPANTQPYYAQQPPSLGYPPQSGYPQPGNLIAPPQADYASWNKRVRARLLDQFPTYLGLVIFCAGYVVLIIQLASSSGSNPHVEAAAVVMIIGVGVMLAGLGWTAYNRWMIAGSTGQSLGKRSTKIILIGEETNAPIGAQKCFHPRSCPHPRRAYGCGLSLAQMGREEANPRRPDHEDHRDQPSS